MESRGWWSAEAEEATKDRIKKEVMQAFKRGETLQRHELKEMFSDVYGGEEPWNLVSITRFERRCPNICSVEGAKRRTARSSQEIRKCLGTVEERAEEVQRRRQRVFEQQQLIETGWTVEVHPLYALYTLHCILLVLTLRLLIVFTASACVAIRRTFSKVGASLLSIDASV